MPISARSLTPLAGLRSALTRRLALAAVSAATLPAALALFAAPAQAVVTTVGSSTVGLQDRIGGGYVTELTPSEYANPLAHPVLHGTNTWAIYWDPTKDYYHGDWQSVIDEYFQSAAEASGSLASVFSVDDQYTDSSNKPASYRQTFRGAYTDTHAYPSSECVDPDPLSVQYRIGAGHTSVCLTGAQLATELEGFVKAHGWPKGLENVFYLLTPPGVTVCLDGGGSTGHCSDYEGSSSSESYKNSFCSYHAAINPGGLATGDANTLIYGVIPWTAGGYGDPDLDQTAGWECQDGGFDPSSKPPEKHEEKKEKDAAEESEFKEETKEKKAEKEHAEKLEGPHEQEPNQLPCPTSDGGCDTGLADLIVNQLGLEQQNIVTDPLLNAWQDANHNENTDECRFFFAPVPGGSVTANLDTDAGTLFNQSLNQHIYYLNDAFNLAAEMLPYPGVPCLAATSLEPKFTAPSPVKTGELVSFDGMESDITQNAGIAFSGGVPKSNYATYTWNFGDGSPTVSGYAPGAPACETPWLTPCAASELHSYQYGGTYEVTLTVTDVGGNTTSVTHPVTIIGPAPPKAEESGGSSGAASSSSSSSSSAGSGASTPAPGAPAPPAAAVVPAPVAAEALVSSKLQSVLHKGLVVRYSVNEQVAGHFDVLLNRATAHRLGIGGPLAVGLPAGSPPELVIAKAVLVTTKGGRSTVDILFSKSTAARLSHVHKVALMLRLVVRNAASHNPVTTTVLSAVTLTG